MAPAPSCSANVAFLHPSREAICFPEVIFVLLLSPMYLAELLSLLLKSFIYAQLGGTAVPRYTTRSPTSKESGWSKEQLICLN